MASTLSFSFVSKMFLVLLTIILPFVSDATASSSHDQPHHGFPLKGATITQIRKAFKSGELTSRQLVESYIRRIHDLNPILHAVQEVNPRALDLADKADQERRDILAAEKWLPMMHGVPVLLTDSIATKDELNTTAGSYALLGSVVPRDAGVVTRLRNNGAIILGKATMSEWGGFRSRKAPHGWSARGGQGKNPYSPEVTPGGSSSGSAISVATDMVTVSIGVESRGSILRPARCNSLVGIRPTTGFTSRSGIVAVSKGLHSVGPISRTVSDAVHVLDSIVGADSHDEATEDASVHIPPQGGFRKFLRPGGLKGKRIGIVTTSLSKDNMRGHTWNESVQQHLNTLRQEGATLVDDITIPDIYMISNWKENGLEHVTLAEFKVSLAAYLKNLTVSPVRSLADVITFNKDHEDIEKMEAYGQDMFLEAEEIKKLGSREKQESSKILFHTKDVFENLMKKNKLDALLTFDEYAYKVLAIGGYPAIEVPAGYYNNGMPFGFCFVGLRFMEFKLIEITYNFEQATKIRKPPLLI